MLVMKALSLGLVKGSIDEVDNRVHLTWVQPRVLDLEQVSLLLIQICMKPNIFSYMIQLKFNGSNHGNQ